MVKTIIEIEYGTDADGNLILKGDADETAYQEIKPYLTAIEHNMNNGITSTLYRVDDDAPDSAVQDMVDASPEHSDYGVQRGIERGLEIQPGTPTPEEVDDLNQRIQAAGGPDLSTVQPKEEPATHIFDDHPGDGVAGISPAWSESNEPGAGGPSVASNAAPNKSFSEMMKNDYPSLEPDTWRCLHPDHASPEVNQTGTDCSLGHADDITDNEYAQPYRAPFDPTSFL